ncbi:MAG: nicotinate-nucleotide--dimethylbenzimidazole phosphoribosyltransferase [Lachnospiraceae bacterium]
MEEEWLDRWNMEAPDAEFEKKIKQNWDAIAKPLDGLGVFERITARIGAIQRTDRPEVKKRALLVLCADNGIVEEGVSQSGQEVTAAVAESLAKGTSTVCHMARVAQCDVIPVNIGIHTPVNQDNLLQKCIRRGTRNFAKEPAMTRGEAVRAIQAGVELVAQCKAQGYQILATGEMGIGNTTTSSAVAAALLDCSVEEMTGKGAGLDEKGLRKKRQVISEAFERYKLRGADAMTVLTSVGGLDLAGLAGIFLGGALYQMPIVLDGVISATAALLAERLKPGCRAYMIASHKSREAAANRILEALGLSAVIDADMALGEGTGAVLLFPMLDQVFAVYQSEHSFSELQMEPYERFGGETPCD